jgi:hypothetical protein
MLDINKTNTIQWIYASKIERDSSKYNKLVSNVLDSDYYEQFQHELQSFFKQINLSEDEVPSDIVCGNMLAKIQSWKDRSIDGLLRLLSSRLKNINNANISEDDKVDRFIEEIIWKENVPILEEFIKSNQKDDLKSTKEWYNFLNNADKKLVFPVIAGWMGSMWILKFFTQWWIEHINNSWDILNISWMDNLIQGLMTIWVLLIIKNFLNLRIKKNI